MTAATPAEGWAGSAGGNDVLRKRWQAAMLPSYGTPPLALVRGAGSTVWDADGRSYLDLIAGIAVDALGHCHPAVTSAVAEQMQRLGHVSNLFATEPAIALAERLTALLGGPFAASGRVFFANSGAEVNEAALKLARKHGRAVGGAAKTGFVAAASSFHGRTFGALAVTGQPAKQEPFEPLIGPVTFVPFGDVEALAAAIDPATTAAVILEPVQGEGGVQPAPAGYLAAARELSRAAGALLIIDEVQTGLGRTGAWFAHQTHGLTGEQAPDVVTLAKALGGGLPIGALVAQGAAADVLVPGDHASTFGGNPVCSAAALAVLDVLEQQHLVERAAELGARWQAEIGALGHPLLAGVRGAGLLFAVVLAAPVAAAAAAAGREHGFLVNAVAGDALRVAPPLVLTDAEADSFTAELPAILETAGHAG